MVLDPLAGLDKLLTATGATLKLTNQKNSVRGSCVYHHAIANKHLCPIRALEQRVHHIISNGGNSNMLCTFFDHRGKGIVIDQDITNMVCLVVVNLKLTERGFPPGQVGFHLLRAGGAVTLAVNRASRYMIKKIGQWSSDTFLMYIPFTNVEGATTLGNRDARQ